MSEKKKPSGAFYRKRKAQERAENEKQAKALTKFFTSTTTGGDKSRNHDISPNRNNVTSGDDLKAAAAGSSRAEPSLVQVRTY